MLKSFPVAHSDIDNSFELVKKLSDVRINKDFSLISLDVASLFTNVPIDLAIESVSSRWHYISTNCTISKFEFITAVRFILNSTYFTFNGTIYRQTFGTPMGSPFSPIIADIVLQDLETRALETLTFTPPFFVKYVDDIALAASSDLLDHTLNIFNTFHPRVQFTMEIKVDNRLNFLDITMILADNQLIFDWYHKLTFSGRYLHFPSNHPLCQKRGTAMGLFNRVILLSHPTFHYKNFKLVVEILLDNGYPLEFVFKVLNERLKTLFHKVNSNLDNTKQIIEPEKVSYLTIPYVPAITEQFKNFTRDLNVKLSYRSLNKLNRFIKIHKDSCPKSIHSNVIYKINCDNCDASYVGQTKRQLHTRISEHKNHIRRNTTNHSVITDHRIT
ncbi:uncharacterized protein [Polyergus mexicanus]|uniref:uncharacterized protein n=1 Tax=Polyergus mexicanus TaxID=615972 RepID=UPI0038B60BE1